MHPEPTLVTADDGLADADITAAVELFFLLKKGVASQLIEVETHAGVVELTGFTTCLLSRERAEEIAKAVRGVRGVINELIIRTPDLPDATLLHAAEEALARDPATTNYNLRCFAHDGQVTVEGTVQTWAEAQLALRALKGVRGVRRLDNRLHVRGGEVLNTDAELTAQLRALLDWDLRIRNELLTLHTDHGTVHVAGTVGTLAERDQIVAAAYQAGAHRVETGDLFVAPWALDRQLRRLCPKPDADVAQAIRDVLRLDARVRAFDPTVHVRDGQATLAGTVGNLKARLAAEQDALNVVGVCEVHNLLLVETHFPSPDGAIRQHVKAALACDPFVGHYSLTINVHNGKVQLYGLVDSHADREQAAEAAAGVTGVVAVDNHLRVRARRAPSAPATGNISPDYVLEQRIRHHYHWSALLHDQDIHIGVHDGRVTLTGTVDSRLDWRLAASEALACGARAVNNHLRLASAGQAPGQASHCQLRPGS